MPATSPPTSILGTTADVKQVILTLVVLAVLGVAGAAAFVWSGVYTVAATEQHTAPVYWLLTTTSDRSVAVRAAAVPPRDLTNPATVAAGGHAYRAHCRQCHGAPGEAPDAMALGMTPVPPNLLRAAREWPSNEIFWVVKHGIKMSGMPGWTFQMSDAEIWEVAAFVKAMAAMTPADYARMTAATPAPDRTGRDGDGDGDGDQDRDRGKLALAQYGCTACHVIEGMVGPDIRVGPPLRRLREQKYIAGVLENTTANLVRWITDPPAVDPRTAMPKVGVTRRDAQDMAAYLHDPD